MIEINSVSASEMLPDMLMSESLENCESYIRRGAVAMAQSMLEIGQGLRAINVGKKYEEKGFKSFKEYMDSDAHGFPFGYTQAAKYIRVFENYGSRLKNLTGAKLEVLDILRTADSETVEELNDSGKLAEMTTKEAKQLKEELEKANEQITMLSAENEKLQSTATESAKANDELSQRIKELEEAPLPVAVEEVSEEKISEIRAEERKAAETEYKKKIADINSKLKAVEAEKKKIKESADKFSEESKITAQEAATTLKELENKLSAEKSAAEKKIKELENKLQSAEKNSTDDDRNKFGIYLGLVQDDLKKLFSMLKDISDEEKRAKYKAAVKKLLSQIQTDLEGE